MNNYEKRMFLDYIEKMMHIIETNSFNFDDVFDFILKEFKLNGKEFPFYDDCLDLDSTKKRSQFAKALKKEVKILKTKIKPKDTLLEKQLNLFKEIYELEEDEFEISKYFIFRDLNNIFRLFFDCCKGNSLKAFTREYLGLRTGRSERILTSLRLKNILEDNRSENLNQNLLRIFDNPKCNTAEKVLNIVVGKPEKSKLLIDDFSYIKKEQETAVNILSSAIKCKAKGINILLYGGVGTGKTEFARLIANQANIPIYSTITQKENCEEASRDDRLVDLYSKQHILSKSRAACILFDEGEDVMNRGFSSYSYASKGYLNQLLENTSVPIIWTTNNIYDVDPAFLRRMTYCIEFEKLSEDVRLNIWKRILKKNKLNVSSGKVLELNKNYDIPPSLISNAIVSTKMIGGNEDDFENFIENVAKVVTKKKSVKNKKGFEMRDYNENLINTDINITNLTDKIKKCEKLNFSLCLYGEPGTGKSLYARYLAKELGIEVILKRASDLISPYVGQTEQNIASAFEEAKSKKAMLIFDEADTFLQNRNNAVRNWEVSQVNEMLTWMESHEYPFVCTTNLLDTLDEASLRRFTFKIKFDFLKYEQVNSAIEHFFGIKNANVNIKGLTAGDFATVKKKTDFLNINDISEITSMLQEEVKIKKTKELQNSIGF